jgi:hypothetical protein
MGQGRVGGRAIAVFRFTCQSEVLKTSTAASHPRGYGKKRGGCVLSAEQSGGGDKRFNTILAKHQTESHDLPGHARYAAKPCGLKLNL